MVRLDTPDNLATSLMVDFLLFISILLPFWRHPIQTFNASQLIAYSLRDRTDKQSFQRRLQCFFGFRHSLKSSILSVPVLPPRPLQDDLPEILKIRHAT
jgi:hypothetical protein